MMSRRQCCLWGCHNRKGRCPEDVEGNRVCSCASLLSTGCPRSGELLSLHYVEKMPESTKKFVVKKVNLTRKGSNGNNWAPTAESCICNFHYQDFKGPTRSNNKVLPQYFKRPSSTFYKPPSKRRVLMRSPAIETVIEDVDNDHGHEEESTNDEEVSSGNDSSALEVSDLKQKILRLKSQVHHLQSTLQRLDPSLLSDSQLIMYSGLGQDEFQCLARWLTTTSIGRRSVSPLSTMSDCTLTFSQKLLMTLMRIRQNLMQDDLACRFCVDQSSVSRTLTQWIPMLASTLGGLIVWPHTCIGPPYNFLPNSVAIIDGTEIFIHRPSNLSTQKSSYSDYKSHTTIKFLVAIDTFTGVFIFVSDGFSGNSSDRFTIERSGILDLLKPGQRILADKGYTARDLFAQKRCFLTIPSFLTKGKLTEQEATESRTIASVRIRVENAIRRLKEFKLFTDTLSNRINKKLLDDMVIICCVLCNLKTRLIKEK